MIQFRDLKKQYEVLRPEMDRAIADAVCSGAYIMGQPITDLEHELAEYVGVKHCVTCTNGTDSLRLALMAWGIGKGDAVFVPDFTFFASAEVVALEGATPIFVDIDLNTFNIDPADLERKINLVKQQSILHAKAIVTVDLFGLPADYDNIIPIAKKHDLLVLEDGAQGFGGEINGRKACSFGDIASTSFFPAKPLGCYGDGGAIFTNNDNWAETLRSLRQHGKGANKYDNVRLGLNSRLDTIQAAILRVKLQAFKNHELDAVNSVAEQYHHLLSGNIAKPLIKEGFLSSWAQYTIRIPNRDKVQQSLKALGIPSMVYYPKAMHEQSAFCSLSQYQSACPNTNLATQSVLSLPMHPYLTSEEIKMVADNVNKIIDNE